jgi:hypothetical protein
MTDIKQDARRSQRIDDLEADLAASPFALRSPWLDVAVALLGALIAWAVFA